MEAFCENLGDEIVPYMDPLMEKLLSLLRTANRQTQVTARPAPPTRRPDAASAATRGTAHIPSASWPLGPVAVPLPLRSVGLPQEMAVSAIGSTASAAGDKFLRFGRSLCLRLAQRNSAEAFRPERESVRALAVQRCARAAIVAAAQVGTVALGQVRSERAGDDGQHHAADIGRLHQAPCPCVPPRVAVAPRHSHAADERVCLQATEVAGIVAVSIGRPNFGPPDTQRRSAAAIMPRSAPCAQRSARGILRAQHSTAQHSTAGVAVQKVTSSHSCG